MEKELKDIKIGVRYTKSFIDKYLNVENKSALIIEAIKHYHNYLTTVSLKEQDIQNILDEFIKKKNSAKWILSDLRTQIKHLKQLLDFTRSLKNIPENKEIIEPIQKKIQTKSMIKCNRCTANIFGETNFKKEFRNGKWRRIYYCKKCNDERIKKQKNSYY